MAERALENEAWYDAEVAPALAALAAACRERGLSFVAVVDFDGDGSVGRTTSLPEHAPGVFRYVNGLAQCGEAHGAVNIDKFLMGVMREAEREGHSSAYLHLLGVATERADG